MRLLPSLGSTPLAFALLFSCSLACLSDAAERPNIVLIIADDMNWNDCGAYGHPHIKTPHIDRLAEEGMRFDRAYLTASSCSPSRSSLITGQYPHNTGAEQLHWPLPPESVTFPGILKANGYYTAAAGKWHLGDNVRDHFDAIYEASTSGFQLPSGDGTQPPQMIASRPSGCEDWIPALRGRDPEKPFFFWLAALDPHREYQEGALLPPHALEDVIVPDHLPDTPAVREDLRLYYDEIGRLDRYVGDVLNELEQQQVADETVVIFISDNGRPFPRDKTTLYEGGIKTPWIVRWPGRVAAGTATSNLVSAVDLAPTLLQLAGLESAASFEGVSFAPILADPAASVRNFAFAEDHWHDYEDHARAVISERFKLIRNTYPDLPSTPPADAGRSPTWQTMQKLHQQGKLTELQRSCFIAPRPEFELYDLQGDPNEAHNLADDPHSKEARTKLIAALDAWSERTGDFVPSKRTPDEFDRVTGEPDHSVRVRPRKSKKEMFGTYGPY